MLNADVVRDVGSLLKEGFLGEEQKLKDQSEVAKMIGGIDLLSELSKSEPGLAVAILHVGSRARLGLKSNTDSARNEFLGVFPPMLNFISDNAESLNVSDIYAQLTRKKIVPNKQFFVSINLVSQLRELVNIIPKE